MTMKLREQIAAAVNHHIDNEETSADIADSILTLLPSPNPSTGAEVTREELTGVIRFAVIHCKEDKSITNSVVQALTAAHFTITRSPSQTQGK